MTKRRPTQGASSPASAPSSDDAFTAAIFEFSVWAKKNLQLVGIIGAVAVVSVGGVLYGLSQRSARLDQAAIELQTVRQTALTREPQVAAAELQAFIARFANTDFALEARLLLAELQLTEDRPEEAIALLREVAPAYGSALLVQASYLLAVSYEENLQWSEAADLYRQLQTRAPYPFQRKEAADGLARSLVAVGDHEGAVAALEGLLATLDPTDPSWALYDMRAAELRAAARAR